jgi:hypothetical protein
MRRMNEHKTSKGNCSKECTVPPAVNGSKTSLSKPSIICPENKPKAVPAKAAMAVKN